MKRMASIVSVAVCGVLILSGLAPLAFAADAEADSDAKHKEMLKRLTEEAAVKEKHKQLSAEAFFKTGEKRYHERQYEKAEQDLKSALILNPNHAKAREYLDSVQRILGKGDADRIIVGKRIETQVELGHQRARMLKAMAEARKLLRQQDYARSLEKLDEARNIAKVLATRVDVGRETGEINSLTEKAAAARDAASKKKAERMSKQANDLAKAEKDRVLDLQRQRITRLFDDAKERYKDTRYLDAVRKCDEVLKLDPRNKEVIAFRDDCIEVQIAVDIKRYEKEKKSETAATWRRTRKEAIPYTDWRPLYPEDWDEKRLRTAGTQIEVESEEEAKWKKDLEVKLEERVSFDFIATPLDDVVAFLRQLRRVNIVVDKAAIEGRGNLDLTLRLEKVKFRDALEWALRLLDLKYTLENGAIYISTKEKIGQSQKTVTRFYDVTDLTIDIRNFKPNVQAISNADLDNEDMDDIFNEEDGDGGGESKTFTGDSLVEFIKSVIAPGSWADVQLGGGELDL